MTVNSFSANEINVYFASNYLDSDHHQPFLTGSPDRTTFNFNEVSEAEVVNALSEISSNDIGIDNISPRFLKMILPMVINQVTFLFNTILLLLLLGFTTSLLGLTPALNLVF